MKENLLFPGRILDTERAKEVVAKAFRELTFPPELHRLIRLDGPRVGGDKRDYLHRFYLSRPGGGLEEAPSLFLHRFVSSDVDHEIHCHPWLWSVSYILAGSYVEERTTGERHDDGTKVFLRGRLSEERLGPGSRNLILADHFHRVSLETEDVWTLFLHGPRVGNWGFVPKPSKNERDGLVPIRVVEGKTFDRRDT